MPFFNNRGTMVNYFKVGVITTAHGVHGEVKVYPTTDDVQRFKKAKNLILFNREDVEPSEPLDIRKVTSVKFFKQFVLLKLEGVDTMDDALKLRNYFLYVSRKDAVKCEKDEYFIADLYGLDVFDEEGNKLGTLKEVYQTGANDVYEIEKEDNTTFLIPAIHECVKNVDIMNNKMIIHVMEGLL